MPRAPASSSTIVAGDSALCLSANAPTDGAPLVLKNCNGEETQQWQVTADGTIRAAGHCMDVAGAEEAMGTPVQIATCNGNRAQQFALEAGRLVSKLTGNCVDVAGSRVVRGAAAIVRACAKVGDRTWQQLA